MMCISYFVKLRIHSLVHFSVSTFLDSTDVEAYLQVENDLFRARLSALKVSETFVDFVQPSAP